MTALRRCPCGLDFLPTHPTHRPLQRYCCKACSHAAADRRRGHAQSPMIPLLGVEVPCERCGAPFLRTRAVGRTRRYCSDRCASAARMRRLRASWKAAA